MRSSAAFRIPVACDGHGRLLPPEEASKRGRYRCPACEGEVDLHAGELKKRHYHHRASACAPETVLHLSAKRLIAQAVDAWKNGGRAPVFVRRCSSPSCERTTRQAMPKKIRRAELELRVASGHVVDVGLVGLADLPIAAIEIVFSHKVDDDKARELRLPWVELDAESVCASHGLVLTPVRDRFLPWLCAEHSGERGVATRDARASRKTLALILRSLSYRLEDFPGFRVDELVQCPNGHEMIRFAWDGSEPPWPRPPHVVADAGQEDSFYDRTEKKLRRVLAFRRTWASACHRCSARVSTPKKQLSATARRRPHS